MLYLKAILLGIIEGVTEFMPISSTAHLMFFSELLQFSTPAHELFETAIQLGAILAVCFYFQKNLLKAATTLHKKESQFFVFSLILGFIPVAIFGLKFHSLIKTAFNSTLTISLSLLIGGVIMILVERLKIKPVIKNSEKVPLKTAFIIGLFQCVALVPGVSRSGGTIVGALLLKADRKTAVEFSFLLAIPTIMAASAYDMYKHIGELNGENIGLILVGMLSAFVTALFTVKILLEFIIKRGLTLFGWYRIIIGTAGVMLVIFGANALLTR